MSVIEPEKICLNCEYFDHWPKDSPVGDCTGPGDRFTPEVNHTCKNFYLSSTHPSRGNYEGD